MSITTINVVDLSITTNKADSKKTVIFMSDFPDKNVVTADIVMRGYAGWNSRRALQVVHKILPEFHIQEVDGIHRPALMIVYFGGNDATRPDPSGLGPHVPLDEYVANMKNIALYIRRVSPKTRMIFLSTPPVSEEQLRKDPNNFDSEGNLKKTNENCRIYSEALLDLCRQLKIEAIDLWSAIQTEPLWEEICFWDGVHFSAVGSKIVSTEILKFLTQTNWVPSLHWRSMPVDFGDDSPYDPIGPDGTPVNISNKPFPAHVVWPK